MPNTVDDFFHWYGADLVQTPASDVQRSNGVLKSQQRVMRRLMTNPGDYPSHPTYGGGLGQWVGRLADIPKITALIVGQMALEATVSQNPPAQVSVVALANGTFSVNVTYTVAPEQLPASLNFSVKE